MNSYVPENYGIYLRKNTKNIAMLVHDPKDILPDRLKLDGWVILWITYEGFIESTDTIACPHTWKRDINSISDWLSKSSCVYLGNLGNVCVDYLTDE